MGCRPLRGLADRYDKFPGLTPPALCCHPLRGFLMEKLRMTTRRKVIGIRIFSLWGVAVHALLKVSLAVAATASSQATPQPLTVPADSERWLLEAQAKVVDYQGR